MQMGDLLRYNKRLCQSFQVLSVRRIRQYCSTNGRSIAIEMGGVLQCFFETAGVGVSETLRILGGSLHLFPRIPERGG